jgi:hypothetical protein
MNTNKKIIELSENSVLNQQIINELEELLVFCPPRELRQTFHELFFGFLKSLDMELVDRNFKEIAADYYFLYKFLEKAEKK